MKCALCAVTFSLSPSVSASLYLLPLILGSREHYIRSSVSIYLSYPMNTEFHGNHPNFANYIKDGNFVLEHDSVILFCFVLLKGLIVLGSSSTHLSIKSTCPHHAGHAGPLGMLSCHHHDTDQLSNLEKCHDNVLAVTLFMPLGLLSFRSLVCYHRPCNC